MLNISDENYEANNITVTVEWAQLLDASYIVEVSPLVPIVNGHRLTIPYNTEYNFSVIAVTPCGNAISFIRLKYG